MPSSFRNYPIYKAFVNEHPFSCEMLAALNQYGVKGLLSPDNSNGLRRQMSSNDDLTGFSPTNAIQIPYPKSEYDFSYSGTYSIYNWEVFFHSVSLIARQLRQNNKFAEAIRWLNYVFDPADTDTSLLDLRFWQIKPFMVNVTQQSIQNMIRLLSASNLSAADMQLRLQYEAQIAEWRRNPFDPHAIAAMRPRAYMLWTVMEYVSTLSDWADYLFRQDTMESINEAINLYVIAKEILGPRPKKVDRPSPAPQSFDDIVGTLSSFSNVLVAFENQMTGLNMCNCSKEESSAGGSAGGGSVSVTDSPCAPSSGVTSLPDLLFCVPDNPKLVEMWDRVEDRLFKIRHCMNIDGKKRELALFAPPIDPAMLVQAAAAGISIGDALADMAAPLPHYRFNYLIQKANEFCNEVKGLGSQLLGLLEKKDAEELSLFRQVHEQNIMKSARALKQMAIEEAKQSYATLQSSKNLIQIRLDDYSARQYRNDRELSAMTLTRTADGFMYAEQGARLLAGLINLLPDIDITSSVMTTPPSVSAGTSVRLPSGGDKLSILTNAGANALGIVTSALRNKASQSLTFASYDRRQEDWELQKKSAREELLQVDRQLLGAQIRIAVTEKELANHDLQVAQSEEMYDWLKNKYTNAKLYSWMVGQVKTVYRQAFNLAYDMAKRTQVCYEYELGKSASNVIQYGQWDSAKSGLLAGERLSVQLKQLETDFIKNNAREYELSKNISLALLDPRALQELITNGTCSFDFPELLFDLDYPGQYFRRIKSVSISIPCIAGPNTNINAMLQMNSHGRRNKASLSPTDFVSQSGFGESIATSSAQNDSGVFELNFRDERYVPFEGKGAVSNWTLDLTQIERSGKQTIRQFDFSTIADVVVHLKYTARHDDNFATDVKTNINIDLSNLANAFSANGVQYALSLRHDLPNEWHALKQTTTSSLSLQKSRLPYFIQAINPVMNGVTLYVDTSLTTFTSPLSILVNGSAVTLTNVSGTSVYTSSTITGLTFGTAFTLAQATTNGLNVSDIKEIAIVAKVGVS